jgi:hypothetical protein
MQVLYQLSYTPKGSPMLAVGNSLPERSIKQRFDQLERM